MSGALDRDGYDHDDAVNHPRFAELRECEACERWFERADRRVTAARRRLACHRPARPPSR